MKRWLNYIIAFLIIIIINFAVPRMLPGNPLDVIYGDEVMIKFSTETKAYISSYYGTDKPVIIQFFLYLTSIFKGNLGYSFYYKKPVIELLLSHMPYTLILMSLAIIFATAVAIVLGIESGWRRGRKPDRFILFSVVFSSSFPSFFIGSIFLIVFGVLLNLLPFQGARALYSGMSNMSIFIDFVRHLILPFLSLVVIFLPSTYLLTRNSMISNLKEPYVLLARAKGLSENRIKYIHAGINSLIPVTTHMGIRLGTMMLTGTLFIEIVFSYPGMGSLIYNSITNRDYPVLQGCFLFTAFLVLLINFLMDLLYSRLDPRIKYAY